jgi:ribosome-associated protein
MLFISPNIKIPVSECQFTFARSGGPGGQNVNKVNSKAIMRWSVAASPSLPAAVRSRFLARYAKRITGEGELILTSQKYRDQNRNIDDCLEKLKAMIVAVAVAPTPRRPTKPTFAAKLRRRQSKYEHSKKKQQRRAPLTEE